MIAARWNRDVLRVEGPDAAEYLQGQLSADVSALVVGQSTLGLLLEPTGKMFALLRVWRTGETEFLLDTDDGHGEAVSERLNRFKLRTDATIEALDWECAVIRESGDSAHTHDHAAAEARVAKMAESAADTGAELVGLCMWPGASGIDMLGPTVAAPVGVQPADHRELEALRIRAGWPAQGREIVESTIPAELGSWLITASVSFTKGCFVGQELTARVDSRGGNVPRVLTTLVFDPEMGEGISEGTELFEPGSDTAGAVVTSAATDPTTGERVALAFVRRGVERPQTLVPNA